MHIKEEILDEDDPLNLERKEKIKKNTILNEYNVINKEKVYPINLAKLILKEHDYHFISIEDDAINKREIFYYKNGFYHRNGHIKIRQLCNYYLGEYTTEHYKNEVVGFIKDVETIHRDGLEPPVNLINVKNGILNLQTGELSEHTPDFYFLNQLPVTYNPDADCPEIKKFFNEIFPDTYIKYIPVLQEMFGYCLYRDYIQHVAFMLLGTGRNGKGITQQILEHMLGKGNYCNRTLKELTEDRFAKADLYGRYACLGAEISRRALEESGDFKNLTGGESITGQRKFMGAFSFRNYAKLIFNANELPWHKDFSYAFYQRWIVIIFSVTFSRGDDRTQPGILKERGLVTKRELSGLLNWSIEGLKRLMENKDFSTDKNEDMCELWETLAIPAKRFITDNLEESLGEGLPKEDVYKRYVKWSKKQNFPIEPKQTFSQKLKHYIPECKLGEIRTGKKRIKAYRNITWKLTDGEYVGPGSGLMSTEEKQQRIVRND